MRCGRIVWSICRPVEELVSIEHGRNVFFMQPSFDDLTQRLLAFRDERDWQRFHSLKNLMLSVNLEASELLELVQWKDDEAVKAALSEPEFQERLAEECADVLNYLLLICELAGINLGAAALEKIDRNAAKYPIEKSRGRATKYTEL